jgi:hypothetical protein
MSAKYYCWAEKFTRQEEGTRLFNRSVFKHVVGNIIPKFSVECTRAKPLICIFFNFFT